MDSLKQVYNFVSLSKMFSGQTKIMFVFRKMYASSPSWIYKAVGGGEENMGAGVKRWMMLEHTRTHDFAVNFGLGASSKSQKLKTISMRGFVRSWTQEGLPWGMDNTL